ncbi:MAG TPA: PEP-CTERM sorting domain-containing protein [Caldimonas sp.]
MVAAAAPTVTLTGWTFGSGNAVDVNAPLYSGQAGGYTGALSGFGAPFDTASFQAYCVELTQQFSFGSGGMTDYSIVPGATDPQWLNPAASANRIGQLITYVNANPTAVDTAAESTSLQLAIWNSIYDTDNTLTGGTFTDTSGYKTYANTLLANSIGTVSNLNVYVLTNSQKQDFLVTRPVPEPSTYALMMAGLMGMSFTGRRRRVPH